MPGLGCYVQHHLARHPDAHLWPSPGGVERLGAYALDGAVEIGWLDADAQATFQEASGIRFSDEQDVFSETTAYRCPPGRRRCSTGTRTRRRTGGTRTTACPSTSAPDPERGTPSSTP